MSVGQPEGRELRQRSMLWSRGRGTPLPCDLPRGLLGTWSVGFVPELQDSPGLGLSSLAPTPTLPPSAICAVGMVSPVRAEAVTSSQVHCLHTVPGAQKVTGKYANHE